MERQVERAASPARGEAHSREAPTFGEGGNFNLFGVLQRVQNWLYLDFTIACLFLFYCTAIGTGMFHSVVFILDYSEDFCMNSTAHSEAHASEELTQLAIGKCLGYFLLMVVTWLLPKFMINMKIWTPPEYIGDSLERRHVETAVISLLVAHTALNFMTCVYLTDALDEPNLIGYDYILQFFSDMFGYVTLFIHLRRFSIQVHYSRVNGRFGNLIKLKYIPRIMLFFHVLFAGFKLAQQSAVLYYCSNRNVPTADVPGPVRLTLVSMVETVLLFVMVDLIWVKESTRASTVQSGTDEEVPTNEETRLLAGDQRKRNGCTRFWASVRSFPHCLNFSDGPRASSFFCIPNLMKCFYVVELLSYPIRMRDRTEDNPNDYFGSRYFIIATIQLGVNALIFICITIFGHARKTTIRCECQYCTNYYFEVENWLRATVIALSFLTLIGCELWRAALNGWETILVIQTCIDFFGYFNLIVCFPSLRTERSVDNAVVKLRLEYFWALHGLLSLFILSSSFFSLFVPLYSIDNAASDLTAQFLAQVAECLLCLKLFFVLTSSSGAPDTPDSSNESGCHTPNESL